MNNLELLPADWPRKAVELKPIDAALYAVLGPGVYEDDYCSLPVLVVVVTEDLKVYRITDPQLQARLLHDLECPGVIQALSLLASTTPYATADGYRLNLNSEPCVS